jgi:hypothetical protein
MSIYPEIYPNGMFNLENPTCLCKTGFNFKTREILRIENLNLILLFKPRNLTKNTKTFNVQQKIAKI